MNPPFTRKPEPAVSVFRATFKRLVLLAAGRRHAFEVSRSTRDNTPVNRAVGGHPELLATVPAHPRHTISKKSRLVCEAPNHACARIQTVHFSGIGSQPNRVVRSLGNGSN